MSWNDAFMMLRLKASRVGKGVNVNQGNIAAPGWLASVGSRLNMPLLKLFSCSPPTQSWPLTSAGASSGSRAIAETSLRTPWPEFCVSQVVVSGGMAKTAATDALARSTLLTCASLDGSIVR